MGDGPEHELLSKDGLGRKKIQQVVASPPASIEIPSTASVSDATMIEWADRDKGTRIRKRGAEARSRQTALDLHSNRVRLHPSSELKLRISY